MKTNDILRFLSLAAIWGGSFIFMRVLAPILGPVATACLRVLIAGSALSIYFRLIKFEVGWKKYGKHYLIIGVVNSAIPFLLYAFAAMHIPASLSVIMNSSSPLFGALFAALWLGDSLTPQKIMGLLLGISGVTLVAIKEAIVMGNLGILATLACLGAAMCYGLAGVYIKKFTPFLKPLAIAGASQLAAGLVLVPFLVIAPVRGTIDTPIVINMLGLSLLCSALAYVLFYKLVADVGPAKALTVTFLMPVFGLIWGVLFLQEKITLQMIFGCAFIITGTTLVLFKRKTS